jgi:hypothetical protein
MHRIIRRRIRRLRLGNLYPGQIRHIVVIHWDQMSIDCHDREHGGATSCHRIAVTSARQPQRNARRVERSYLEQAYAVERHTRAVNAGLRARPEDRDGDDDQYRRRRETKEQRYCVDLILPLASEKPHTLETAAHPETIYKHILLHDGQPPLCRERRIRTAHRRKAIGPVILAQSGHRDGTRARCRPHHHRRRPLKRAFEVCERCVRAVAEQRATTSVRSGTVERTRDWKAGTTLTNGARCKKRSPRTVLLDERRHVADGDREGARLRPVDARWASGWYSTKPSRPRQLHRDWHGGHRLEHPRPPPCVRSESHEQGLYAFI